jgi:hypothetical protein
MIESALYCARSAETYGLGTRVDGLCTRSCIGVA